MGNKGFPQKTIGDLLQEIEDLASQKAALLAACILAQDQIIGMATWLKASGQPGIAKGAYKILDQLTSVIKESE